MFNNVVRGAPTRAAAAPVLSGMSSGLPNEWITVASKEQLDGGGLFLLVAATGYNERFIGFITPQSLGDPFTDITVQRNMDVRFAKRFGDLEIAQTSGAPRPFRWALYQLV